MSKAIFDDIAEGLREAIAIAKGAPDPSTYRVHILASNRRVRRKRNRTVALER